MNKLPLDFLYDRKSGKLAIQPEFDKARLQDEDLRIWALTGGMSDPPLEFRSSSRERMLSEKRQLEEEIDGMLLNIQDMFRNIHRKEMVLRRKASTLAPIRLLPPEIIRHVLAALDPISLPGDKLTLYRLMRVCRLWATTIRDMPEMWSNIVITGELPHQRWLAHHIEQSKAVPLNIVCSQKIHSELLLENLLIRSPNWCSFRFDPTYGTTQNHISRLFIALRQASTLRELEMVDYYQKIMDFWDQLSDQSSISLPSLKTLKLRNFNRLPCFLSLPSLDYLEFESVRITSDQFYGWVEQMPKLRYIRIHNLHLNAQPDDLDRESRRLMDSPPQFPLLEKLVVNASIYRGNRTHPIYLAIMAGSPILSTVHLTTALAEHFNIMENSLKELPQIKSLTLVVDTDASRLDQLNPITYLSHFSEVENLALQQLGRRSERAMVKVLDTISHAINSKSNLCARIQKLSFHELVDSRLSESVIDALRHLADSITKRPAPCLVSIRARDRVLTRDETPLLVNYFLRREMDKKVDNSDSGL